MLSYARVQLNMSRDEFMGITPRYFQALCKQVERLDRPRNATLEVMVGQLLAMVGNIGYTGLEKPMQPEDFMPSVWAAKAKAKPKRMRRSSRKKITAMWRRTMEQAKAYQDEQVRRGIK